MISALGQPHEQFKRPLQVADRLWMRHLQRGTLSRPPLVLDSLGNVTRAIVVTGKVRKVVIETLSVKFFDGLGRALVQNSAAFTEYGAVADLLGQSVLELVFDVTRGGLLVNKLAKLQL